MKENSNENINIDDLLIAEKNYRESGNYNECLDTCLNILNEIKSISNNNQYKIISKLFIYPDQSNYVRIYLLHSLIQDNNFINSINLKRKYYQLLIDSFKNKKANDLLKEKNDIIKLYEKSDLDNFDDLDKYIVDFVSNQDLISLNDEQKDKIETEIKLINEDKNYYKRSISLGNTFLPTSLSSSSAKRLASQDNSLPQSSIQTIQTSFEEINTIGQNNVDMSVQKMIKTSEQKKSEIKHLLKKYKINAHLPQITMSISANLNSNQFLELIKNIFLKLNYISICNIRDTEFENLNIYEYKPKNCCEKIKYLIKNKYIKNEFYVMIILKRDVNNFNRGIHTFLNDINERKLSIKSIKGNEKNIIQFLINFLSKLCLSINKIKIIEQSKILLKYNLEEIIQKIIYNKKIEIFKSKNISKDILYKSKNSNYQQLIDDETYVEKTNLNSKKFYELYKILSNEDYELGRQIKLFIDNFKKKYQNLTLNQINNIDTKNIMMEIAKILELCTNSLNSTYNNFNNKEDNGDEITYFSLASEQYLFNKIYYIIYNIYDKKYEKENKEFLLKQKDINQKLNINELFKKIEVKKKYRGNDKIPFKSVIDIINKVPLEQSIKKKFEILTYGSLEIRTYILEYTNGKHELDSMDDELPIIIYITTQIKVGNIFAELNIVEEYIKCILRNSLIQNKMVTNLMSSLGFISNNWNSETSSFENI